MGLPLCNGMNTILIVVNRLSKERRYILMHASEYGILAEETTKVLIYEIFS